MYKTAMFLMCAMMLALAGTAAAEQTTVKDAKQTIVSPKAYAEKYPTIIVYTLSTCPHCMELKQYLKDNNIPFVNREVDLDETHMADLMSIYDSMGVPEAKRGVPLMIIGDKIRLQGFNREKIEIAIKEAIKTKNEANKP